MKIRVQVQPRFKEVEVELPIYRKNKGIRCHFVKVDSEEDCVWVTIGASIGICATSICMTDDYEDCSKEKFDKAFEEVLTTIKNRKDAR